jgi:hypothetical protein
LKKEAKTFITFIVMPGLGPGTHDFAAARKSWMAGPSPAMTT